MSSYKRSYNRSYSVPTAFLQLLQTFGKTPQSGTPAVSPALWAQTCAQLPGRAAARSPTRLPCRLPARPPSLPFRKPRRLAVNVRITCFESAGKKKCGLHVRSYTLGNSFPPRADVEWVPKEREPQECSRDFPCGGCQKSEEPNNARVTSQSEAMAACMHACGCTYISLALVTAPR